jgi:amino acid transporter
LSITPSDPSAPQRPAAEAQPQGIRATSGLVRAASARDALIFAISATSVGIILSWSQLYGTAFYPGSNWYVALALSTAAAAVLAAGYQYWARVFPRSGGDYVFVSRGAHPGLALGLNVMFVLAMQVSAAYTMSILQPLYVSLGQTLADTTGWHGFASYADWANTNTGFAVMGVLMIAIATVIAWFGIKPTLRFIAGLFVVGFTGMVIVTIALVFTSKSTFVSHLEGFVGKSPAEIIGIAQKNGFAYGGFSWADTFGTYGWLVTGAFFSPLLVYLGGEIREATQVMRWAIVAGAVIIGISVLAWSAALNGVTTRELTGALAYNNFYAPDASTPTLFYPHEAMRVAWGTTGAGAILTLIGYAAVLAWVLMWTPVAIAFGTRAILAWALDGVAPRALAYVSPRRRTPAVALIVCFVAGSAWMLAFAFKPSFRTVALNVPLFSSIAATMIIGMLFPLIRRELFRNSAASDERVGRIPGMTLVCGVAGAVMAASVYNVWRDPVQGTDRTPIWVCAGVFVVVALYYLALQVYRRRRGEDVGAIFKRIPVE